MVDKAGDKKVTIGNLREYLELCEDLYDRLLVKERKFDPRESLEEVKKKLSL